MTAVRGALSAQRDDVTTLSQQFLHFLETGEAADGLFAEDVFLDYTPPLWRLQVRNRDAVIAQRHATHPAPGRLLRSRVDVTVTGFVIEVEETWEDHGDTWYCRELMRADIENGSISELSVYCTGDWSSAHVARHRDEVTLLRR